MMGFHLFEFFENLEYIYEHQLPILVNYICANLNSDYSLNYWYYYEAYNYCNKLYIVINWRKERGLAPKAKKGEMICYDTEELVNFISDKKHLNCCGSV